MYNCVSSHNATAFEINVGTGMASISLALVNEKGLIMLELPQGHQNEDQSAEDVETFELQSRTVEALNIPGLKLLVQVWCHGGINLDYLMEYLTKCFNDTLIDYQIERAVTKLNASMSKGPGLPASLFVDGDLTSPEQVSKEQTQSEPERQHESWKVDNSFPLFLDSSMRLLRSSSELKNPTVQELSSPVKLPHWIIDEFASEVHEIIQEDSGLLNPVMVKRNHEVKNLAQLKTDVGVDQYDVLTPSSHFDIYETEARPTKLKVTPMQNDRIVIIAGVRSFSGRYGVWKPSSLLGHDLDLRKNSIQSDSSGMSTPTASNAFHLRWPSIDDTNAETLPATGRKLSNKFAVQQLTKSAMDDFMLYPGYLHASALELGSRSCFLTIVIENSRVSVFTYNWNRNKCQSLFNQILRSLSWNNIRMQFLERQRPSLRAPLDMDENRKQLSRSYQPGISYSTSYGGLGGFGLAAQHFNQRQQQQVLDTTDSQQIKKMYSMGADSLQSSAVEFLTWFVKQLRIPISRSGLKTPEVISSEKMTKRPSGALLSATLRDRDDIFQSNESLNRSLERLGERAFSVTEMAAILRSVRLHFSRYPLFFRRETLFASSRLMETPKMNLEKTSSLYSAPSSPPGMIGTEAPFDILPSPWLEKINRVYLNDYGEYLQHIGMESTDYFEHIGSSNVGTDFNSPTMFEHEQSTTLYVIKRLSLGALIVQLGVDGLFGCVNLYIVRYPSFGSGVDETDLEESFKSNNDDVEKEFRAECNQLKSSIHIHSCK
jgi:hypothetical protein